VVAALRRLADSWAQAGGATTIATAVEPGIMPSRDMQQYLDPKYSTVLPVSFNKKDLLIYAVGIGCNDEKWVYAENESFEMFPTFPVSLFFKGDSADAHVMRENPVAEVLNPPFPSKDFGVRAGLDGERYIECVRPLPVEGGSFVWKTDYTAITRKGASGILTEYETTLEGTDGTVYYRFWSAQFSLGKIPEFDDAGVSQGLSVTMPQRAPDATERFQTSPLQSFMYSLTGDFNAP
jgi:peroxisomal enoyl-CoA hydratase 2